MGHFWLEFDNNGHRQRYDFNQASVTIGREQGCDFHLDHPTVSRQHATIVDSAGNFQLVVMSTNGLTAVDGQKVQGTVPLRPGMTIQVGEVQLGFRAAIGGAGFGDVATEQFSLGQVNTNAATAAMPVVEESTAPSQQGGLPSWQQALNAPSPQQGFGAAPQQGFGGAPQAGFGAAPPQGFGAQGAAPQGFGAQPGGAPPAAGPPPNGGDAGEDEFKIKSWEEIAAEAATGAHEAVGGMTDFQRIQKAQAKANKKDGGTSPVLLVVLVLAIGGVAAMFMMDDGPKDGGDDKSGNLPDRCAGLRICYPEEKEPKCANKSDCMTRAQTAYNVADQLYSKKGADITNRYEAYKQLDKAGRFMAQAGVEKPPESMKDYEKHLLQYEEELDKIHREHKIRDHKAQQRKMFWDKARNVRAWQAYFPDTYNEWYQEAIEAERRMKDNGTWPKKFDKAPKIKKH